MPLESDLYAPVKALLEGQGYSVKGEIRDVTWSPCEATSRR
jgi:hypothetical protein